MIPWAFLFLVLCYLALRLVFTTRRPRGQTQIDRRVRFHR